MLDINKLVKNATMALNEYANFNQEKIDEFVYTMVQSAVKNCKKLAKMAVEETKRRVLEDKITKDTFVTDIIYNSIKKIKTVGIISRNEKEKLIKIAEPAGVIVGITPVTNPTSTVIFKSLICVKSRNPIIFAFHPSAQKCSTLAAEILRDAAVKSGAPKNCIQWIEASSIQATKELMNHKDVHLVLATGGTEMVKSAYSTGKPALGVGPGNVPCYVEKTANLKEVGKNIITSKTFDNGMICASEQSVVVDKEVSSRFEKAMKEEKCYFLNESEIEQLSKLLVNSEKNCLNAEIVGKSACFIAKKAGFIVPEDTKLLIAKISGIGKDFPLSIEKLSPILAYFQVDGHKEGFKVCEEILNFNGLGHTAVIHSNDKKIILDFGLKMRANRILVNVPASQGAIGGIFNSDMPSMTLGCGTYGKNSTADNVSVMNLLNIKRLYLN